VPLRLSSRCVNLGIKQMRWLWMRPGLCLLWEDNTPLLLYMVLSFSNFAGALYYRVAPSYAPYPPPPPAPASVVAAIPSLVRYSRSSTPCSPPLLQPLLPPPPPLGCQPRPAPPPTYRDGVRCPRWCLTSATTGVAAHFTRRPLGLCPSKAPTLAHAPLPSSSLSTSSSAGGGELGISPAW